MKAEEFIRRAKAVHGERFDYSMVRDIKNLKEKVLIVDTTLGIAEQQAHLHLKGRIPIKFKSKYIKSPPYRKGTSRREEIRTLESFVTRGRELFGPIFDYSKVSFTKSSDIVTIIYEGTEYKQRVSSHMSGLLPLALSAKMRRHREIDARTKKFIKRAIAVHGNKYDYSKVVYINSHHPVIIVDEKYGEFMQTPSNHLAGKESKIRGNRKKIGCINNKVVAMFPTRPINLYLIRIIIGSDIYHKVGLSKNPKHRFARIAHDVHGFVQPIAIYSGPLSIAYDVEQLVVSRYSDSGGKLLFAGKSECFSGDFDTAWFYSIVKNPLLERVL